MTLNRIRWWGPNCREKEKPCSVKLRLTMQLEGIPSFLMTIELEETVIICKSLLKEITYDRQPRYNESDVDVHN